MFQRNSLVVTEYRVISEKRFVALVAVDSPAFLHVGAFADGYLLVATVTVQGFMLCAAGNSKNCAKDQKKAN